MKHRPHPQALLEEARQVLKESVIPELDGQRKYDALMVANAIGMVARELNEQNSAQATATEGAVDEFVAQNASKAALKQGADIPEQALADLIREREVAVTDPTLLALLRALTDARLAVNNPGYLRR